MTNRGEWVKKIEEERSSSENILQRQPKPCIYRIPEYMISKQEAYSPQMVSLGPYHRNKEHLKKMEKHKRRALIQFLNKSGKGVQSYLEALDQVAVELKNAYDDDIKCDNETFLQLMLQDGCFILETLGADYGKSTDHGHKNYSDEDPVFGSHGKRNIRLKLSCDMLMLENQLPMLLLEKLLSEARGRDEGSGQPKMLQPDVGYYLSELILNYFGVQSSSSPNVRKGLHILDVYWKGMVGEYHGQGSLPPSTKPKQKFPTLPSATALVKAGIKIESANSTYLNDICFDGKVLRLPKLVVTDLTELLSLNLMAFERLHVGTKNYEMSFYIAFMKVMIQDAQDVSLLRWRGIIQNLMGMDEDVSNLFKSLSKDFSFSLGDPRVGVLIRLSDHCSTAWSRFRTDFYDTYFRNPWSFLTTAFLFILAVLQTIFSIMGSR